MIVKIDEPSSVPIADLDKSYKKQNEQIIMSRFLARTPDNDIYIIEPDKSQGVPKISIGSIIEFDGTIYHNVVSALDIIEDENITDGNCYIKLKLENDGINVYITNEEPPDFDYIKKGHYKIESDTLIKYLFVKIVRKNNLYTNILKLLEDKLPIGIILPIHYIGANSETIDIKTPMPEYGIWEKISGGGFLRFKSANANEARNAYGIQSDAIRNIIGNIDLTAGNLSSSGVFRGSRSARQEMSYISRGYNVTNGTTFDISKIVPTSNIENRVYNEGTWEFYRRIA